MVLKIFKWMAGLQSIWQSIPNNTNFMKDSLSTVMIGINCGGNQLGFHVAGMKHTF